MFECDNISKDIRVLFMTSIMKKYGYFIASVVLLLIFIIFTILVKTVDVAFIDFEKATNKFYLGFSTLNFKFADFINGLGKTNTMGKFSDIILYLSFGYILILLVFAIIELVKVKSFKKLNINYYVALGGYVLTAVLYLVFEVVKVNYSPDSLIDKLKPSYPSSHVFIGCMFYLINTFTAMKLLKPEKDWIKPITYLATGIICILLVFTRALSAKHWLTDLIASIILVGATYTLFIGVSKKLSPEEPKIIESEE